MRYEYHTPWRENHGYISVFDIKSGSIVVPDSSIGKVSPLYPKGYLPLIGASAAGLFGQDADPGATATTSAPRIGLAYRPWDERTVFRAGYGVYYDVVPFSFINGGSPFALTEQPYTNPLDNPVLTLPRVYPDAGTAGPSSVGIPGAVRPDLQMRLQHAVQLHRSSTSSGTRASV